MTADTAPAARGPAGSGHAGGGHAGSADWLGCPDCDALQRAVPLDVGGVVRCYRCGAPLYRRPKDGIERSFAFAVASLICFLVSNSFPILELQLSGSRSQTTLLGAVGMLLKQDMNLVALLVLLTTVVIPLLQLAALVALLYPVLRGHAHWLSAPLFCFVQAVRPWAMVEVFLLGTLVALTKLGSLATAIPGIALWSMIATVVTGAAATANFDSHQFWARLEHIR